MTQLAWLVGRLVKSLFILVHDEQISSDPIGLVGWSKVYSYLYLMSKCSVTFLSWLFGRLGKSVFILVHYEQISSDPIGLVGW